ncbi:MAG: hypothetical protein ACHQFX_13420, partial [Chitinophagales bacterium]
PFVFRTEKKERKRNASHFSANTSFPLYSLSDAPFVFRTEKKERKKNASHFSANTSFSLYSLSDVLFMFLKPLYWFYIRF